MPGCSLHFFLFDPMKGRKAQRRVRRNYVATVTSVKLKMTDRALKRGKLRVVLEFLLIFFGR